MRRFIVVSRFFILLALLSLQACSGTPKEVHEIEKIRSAPLRVRRSMPPESDPACKPPEWLFSSINHDELLRCLSDEFGQISRLEYKLVWGDLPELVLEDPELAPACMLQNLPKIPVPREFFFLADAPDRKDPLCYASGLPERPDQIKGITLPIAKYSVMVEVPVVPKPRTHADLDRVLSSWALAPFYWVKEEQKISAKVMPDAICRACFGSDLDKIEERARTSPTWP
jgi:hypothetical protein